METKQESKVNKAKAATASTAPIRVKRETKRRLLAELAKVNKKDFGRKIRIDDLISVLLPMLTDAHIKSLQNNSMTNADHLERQYRAYISKHGPLTKDEFIGKLLIGEHAVVEASAVRKL